MGRGVMGRGVMGLREWEGRVVRVERNSQVTFDGAEEVEQEEEVVVMVVMVGVVEDEEEEEGEEEEEEEEELSEEFFILGGVPCITVGTNSGRSRECSWGGSALVTPIEQYVGCGWVWAEMEGDSRPGSDAAVYPLSPSWVRLATVEGSHRLIKHGVHSGVSERSLELERLTLRRITSLNAPLEASTPPSPPPVPDVLTITCRCLGCQ
ncbi:hypothetical protein E2C01_001636 [Portunus trituberculatus]|uniref:Uncharacterized protein n=1 Tax=Portunus trituberculatus TaxID=210409 RepID=A0A5B7CIA1_PORTR|nr:hypothetical protein [Portunus trituberculatus]